MTLELPNIVIEALIKALNNGILIQKQARLCDLAALDFIPTEILPHLKLHHQKVIALSPVTAERILLNFAVGKNKEVKSAILRNSNISFILIKVLGDDIDKDIHSSVLLHPKMPGDILIKYPNDHPRWRYRNEDILNKVAQNTYTSSKVLKELSKHKNWQIRERVARNLNTSTDILEILAKDPFDYDNKGSFYVRCGVASNPEIPVVLLEKLAQDRNQSIRASVAYNPSTPKYLLEKLAVYNHKHINSKLIRNPQTPGHILQKIANSRNDISWLENIAENKNTPSETLAELSTRNLGMWTNRLLTAIAKNPNTPSEILKKLGINQYKKIQPNEGYGFFAIQIAVASNPSTSIEILESLYRDKDIFVCQALAKNPKTPIHLIRKLAEKNSYKLSKYRYWDSDWKQIEVVSSDFLRKRYIDTLYMEMSLAQNFNTPTDILDKIANDRSEFVRIEVAKNTNTTLNTLEKLSRQKASNVKTIALQRIHSIHKEIVTNPKTSVDQLKERRCTMNR